MKPVIITNQSGLTKPLLRLRVADNKKIPAVANDPCTCCGGGLCGCEAPYKIVSVFGLRDCCEKFNKSYVLNFVHTSCTDVECTCTWSYHGGPAGCGDPPYGTVLNAYARLSRSKATGYFGWRYGITIDDPTHPLDVLVNVSRLSVPTTYQPGRGCFTAPQQIVDRGNPPPFVCYATADVSIA